MTDATQANSAGPVRLSANQWKVTLLKACVGAGVARGVAEDLADAGLALLSLGRNPSSELLKCLDAFTPVERLSGEWSGDRSVRFQQALLLHHGPSMIDMAQAENNVTFQSDSPFMIAGLAQARTMSHGIGFEITAENSDWLTPASFLSRLSGNLQGVELSLRSVGAIDDQQLQPGIISQPQTVEWNRLQAYANLILVPADSTNRADAGAGLTDND